MYNNFNCKRYFKHAIKYCNFNSVRYFCWLGLIQTRSAVFADHYNFWCPRVILILFVLGSIKNHMGMELIDFFPSGGDSLVIKISPRYDRCHQSLVTSAMSSALISNYFPFYYEFKAKDLIAEYNETRTFNWFWSGFNEIFTAVFRILKSRLMHCRKIVLLSKFVC